MAKKKDTDLEKRKPVRGLKQKAVEGAKQIKIQPLPFVAALLSGVFNVIKLSPSGLVRDSEKLVGALGLGTTPSELTQSLIVNALVRALADLFREQYPFPESAAPPDMDRVRAAFKETVGEGEIEIDRAFFKRPAALPLLEKIAAPLEGWLAASGASAPDARNIVRRLPAYFTYALHEEWRARPADYKPLLDALDTPFDQAAERERAWERYAARLQRQVNEPMFGETFGIVHVFVPLCGYFEEEAEDPEVGARRSRPAPDEKLRGRNEGGVRRVVVDLAEELITWVERAEKKGAVRVIVGGPGSGKSSFARMLAAQLAAKGTRVLYVPLHLIDPEKDLENAIGRFVREQDLLPENPLLPVEQEPRMLLLLDGLDELAMQGKASAEVAQKLMEEALRYVDRRNHGGTRIQVLFGGRDVVVDTSRGALREPGQVLHLLPYHVADEARDAYVDMRKLLALDRRDIWWRNYGLAKGGEHTAMPKTLQRSDLDELTSQPLLGYLIALSFARGIVDFSKPDDVDLNAIHQDLISSVHERDYAGARLPDVRHLSTEQFTQLLEEVALATWHGDGRSTTAKAIHAACTRSGLTALLDVFERNATTGSARLLSAFYFRQCSGQRDGEPRFEFTHKSFCEYLMAKRISRALQRIEEEFALRESTPGRGWSTREALKHWAELLGPTEIDSEVLRFFLGEMSHAGKWIARKCQIALVRMIDELLLEGMPMEMLAFRPAYFEETRRARNAEEGLLACLGACARPFSFRSEVAWPGPAAFCGWLARLNNQAQPIVPLVRGWLGGLVLDRQNLSGASLEGANFVKASVKRAILVRANLEGANLASADLGRARLMDANLQGASLRYADLSGANLEGANLEGADLQHADLRKALLVNVRLKGANLEGANLEGASLVRADLRDARLEGARVHRERLRYTDVRGVSGVEEGPPVQPSQLDIWEELSENTAAAMMDERLLDLEEYLR